MSPRMSNPRFAVAIFAWSCLTLLVGILDLFIGFTISHPFLLTGIMLCLSGLGMALSANSLRRIAH